MSTIMKEKKRKPSILDPFTQDIKYYYDLGVSISSIRKIINEKTPIKLTSNAYQNFINTRLK